MPGGTVNDPQLATSGRVRVWIQTGTANPSLPYLYMGCAQFEKFDQDMGALEPVYCPSSAQRDAWDIVDVIKRTPALPKTAFTQHANRFLQDLWWQIRNRGCLFNAQAVFSNCARPDDRSSWEAIVLYGRSKLVKIGLPVLNVLDGTKNEMIDITGDLEMQIAAVLYNMAFQNVAEVTVVAELVDGFYYDAVQCGECGLPSDGCQKAYALQVSNTGSPGLSSQVIYTADGFNTSAAMDIPPLAGLSASRFAPMGAYCIVIGPNQGQYVYAKFTDIQAGTIAWTAQTSGFVAGKSPKCITVRDPNTGWIGAQGGYIYQISIVGGAVTVLTDGSITTQDINDIHYFGRQIVAVGNSNAVLFSANNGAAWSLITGPAVGQNLSAVWLLNAQTWFVGTGNGKLYYTLNAGASWTQAIIDGVTFTTVNDVQFFDENVGYVAVETGGAGRVYRTTDAGATWTFNGSAIQGLPTNQRINVISPCGYNTVLACGRKTIGGDGILAVAKNVN